MTPEQKKLARHALGLPNDHKRSYRNRYVTTSKHDVWRVMVDNDEADFEYHPAAAEAVRATFFLTRKGAEAALEPGESLDPEDFPAEAA